MKLSSPLKVKKDQKRLEHIYTMFMKGAYLTVRELAEEEDVSLRTIQNDIKPFIDNGILKKDGRKYYIPKEFRVEELLKEAQMEISMMSALYAKAFPDVDTSHVFQEAPKNDDKFYFDFTLESLEDKTIITNIIFAIDKKLAISFLYSDKYANQSQKNVYPLKIANFNSIWYLFAYDLERDKVKTYHINDIKELETLQEDFLGLKRESIEAQTDKMRSPWYDDEQKSVTLKITDLAKEYVKRKNYPNISYIKEDSKSLYVQMHYYNSIEVLRFVKEWLPFVTIEDDEELRRQLKDILEQTLASL